MSSPVGLAQVLAHAAPDLLASLGPVEQYVLGNMFGAWLRPEQRLPLTPWRSCLLQAGRGFGKTHTIGVYVNECVRDGRISANPEQGIALMAPNEDRVEQVQIQTLIATAPAWFKPERYDGGLVWPNGARAYAFTPLEPGRARGGNFEFSWFTEAVDYIATKRWLAFTNLTTATRRGIAQYVVDTTAMGINEIIDHMHAEHARRPDANIQIRGSTFDNPLLARAYIEDECAKYTGRRLREELFGENYGGNAGAGWTKDQIASLRVFQAPPMRRTLVACDPAQNANPDSDETGIVGVGEDAQAKAHYYALADESGHYTPPQWGARVVNMATRLRAVGVFAEKNKLGEGASYPIEVAAQEAGIELRMLGREDAFPPFATPGVLYLKCVQTAVNKISRADGPSALTEAGRVHHVGVFPELEGELTTYEGSGASPNRYDAYNYAIAELAGLGRELVRDGAKAIAGAGAVQAALAKSFAATVGRGRVGM